MIIIHEGAMHKSASTKAKIKRILSLPMFIHKLLGGMHVGKSTFAAVLPVEMASHEHTSTALLVGAFTPQASNFAVGFNLNIK